MTVKQLRLEPKDDKVHVCALTKPVVVSLKHIILSEQDITSYVFLFSISSDAFCLFVHLFCDRSRGSQLMERHFKQDLSL